MKIFLKASIAFTNIQIGVRIVFSHPIVNTCSTVSLSEVGVHSISVLGEEKRVFLRSGSPDQFETPAFGLDELWPGSGSLSPRLTAARVPGSVLGISALQLPVSGWVNSTLPPLPAGIQLQHFTCCLQLCRYCFQKHLLGKILNSWSPWKVSFKENNFQQVTLWRQL